MIGFAYLAILAVASLSIAWAAVLALSGVVWAVVAVARTAIAPADPPDLVWRIAAIGLGIALACLRGINAVSGGTGVLAGRVFGYVLTGILAGATSAVVHHGLNATASWTRSQPGYRGKARHR